MDVDGITRKGIPVVSEKMGKLNSRQKQKRRNNIQIRGYLETRGTREEILQ